MTRHVVLTRSSYGPAWSRKANLRRLQVTRAITARLMARQTTREWSWLVLLDPRDPLIADRMRVYQEAAPAAEFIVWQPPERPVAAPWDPRPAFVRERALERAAATAYRAPWTEALGPRTAPLLQTRIDDDDGFAPDALERIQLAAARLTRRAILMLPVGYRVHNGRAERVRHHSNAWLSLWTPARDRLGVYDFGHRLAAETARVLTVDEQPGWLWYRHPDAISGTRQARGVITEGVRAMFPIDWTLARWSGRVPSPR